MNPLMVTAASYLLGPGGRQTGYLTTDRVPPVPSLGDRGRQRTFHRAAPSESVLSVARIDSGVNIGNRSDSCES